MRAEREARATVSEQRGAAQLAVLGMPIAHSLSPVIHRAAYTQLNLAWTYSAEELGAERLATFLSAHSHWRGFSVTMPLKRAAFELSEPKDEFSRRIGVVNTLVRSKEHWLGYNTDVPGAMQVMRQLLDQPPTSALVLGGGATAASVALAAQELGVQRLVVSARRHEAFEELKRAIGGDNRLSFLQLPNEHSSPELQQKFAHSLSASDLVVNTLPAEAMTSLGDALVPVGSPALFDVTYHPLPTPLCAIWEQQKLPCVDGRELLVQQAVLQIRLFLNDSVDAELPNEPSVVAAMRAACMGE